MTFHFDHIFGDAEMPLDDDLNALAPGFDPFAGVAGGSGTLQIDMSELLTGEETNYYQSLIGVGIWLVELRCINLTQAIGMLSWFMCAPRKGHQEALYQIFAYMKGHLCSHLVFDGRKHDLFEFTKDKISFNWRKHYPEAEDELSEDMLEP